MELNTPNWVLDRLVNIEKNLAASSSKSLSTLKQKAISDFQQQGFPTTKLEDWKYTNVSSLIKTQYKVVENQLDITPGLKSALDLPALGARVVFVNGKFNAGLSELKKLASLGVQLSSLSQAISEDSKILSEHLGKYALSDSSSFVALNTASIDDGVLICTKAGLEISEPIEIIHYATGNDIAVNSRLLLIAEDNSKLAIIERFIGEGSYFNNCVAEIILGENSKVDHYKLQEESTDASHLSRIEARQKTGSIYQNHVFNFGAKLSRNEINPVLQGEKAFTLLHGLNILSAQQHVDNQTILDHAQPNCDSREWYKGIYSDQSKGVFSGTIIVRQDAQKTNAFQSNQSLLLSDEAESNSKPQLKIWADDVKCSHGATVGQLDHDAMFYLRSRGIPKKGAENILIIAFAGDILTPIEIPALRQEIEAKVLAKLSV